MADTAFSLSAAPLFTAPAPSKIPHTSPQMPDANPALRGTLSSAGAGTPSLMKVATGGGVALAVAGMGQKRQRRKTQVRAVASDSASAEDAPPPPPPPFNPAKQIGAMAPLGYFDPAGFSKVGDKEGFNNLRAAEIKHGRVAMMAALGGVVQHFVKFPGFEKVPAGLSAVVTAPGSFGFIALLAFGAGMELGVWVQDPEKEPGNFGNPVGWGSYDDDMRNKEINNGRFAMFAALGIIAADVLTGKDAVQQLGA